MPTEGTVQSGRRRDPRIEPAALAGAMEVYASTGWGGFSYDAVARASGVGKPAIYRRWKDRADLLVSAFESVDFPIAEDRGTLQADLDHYADAWVRWFQAPHLPQAGTLILADSAAHAELGEVYQSRVMGPRVAAVRAITVRAIERGELPSDTAVTAIPELLLGSFFMHWSFAGRTDSFREGLPEFARETVRSLLYGLVPR